MSEKNDLVLTVWYQGILKVFCEAVVFFQHYKNYFNQLFRLEEQHGVAIVCGCMRVLQN